MADHVTGQGDSLGYAENLPARRLEVVDGFYGAPIADRGPTAKFSRVMAATEGGNAEPHATLAAYSTAMTGNRVGNTAVEGYAISHARGPAKDVLGGGFLAEAKEGSTAIPTGVYAQGRATDTGQRAYGVEARVENLTGEPGNYDEMRFAAMLLSLASNAARSGSAIAIYPVENARYDAGVYFQRAIDRFSIIDESDSQVAHKVKGSHGAILDALEATVSGRAIGVRQRSDVSRDNQPIYVLQAGKGDARIGFEIAKVIGWEAGIDQSDGLCFNISNSSGKGDFTDVGIRIFPDGGLVVGNPKGGSKGKGTINVEKVYVDGDLQQ